MRKTQKIDSQYEKDQEYETDSEYELDQFIEEIQRNQMMNKV